MLESNGYLPVKDRKEVGNMDFLKSAGVFKKALQMVPRAGGRKARKKCNDQHVQVRMGDREGAEAV